MAEMLEISKSGLLDIWQGTITMRAPVGANKKEEEENKERKTKTSKESHKPQWHV